MMIIKERGRFGWSRLLSHTIFILSIFCSGFSLKYLEQTAKLAQIFENSCSLSASILALLSTHRGFILCRYTLSSPYSNCNSNCKSMPTLLIYLFVTHWDILQFQLLLVDEVHHRSECDGWSTGPHDGQFGHPLSC